MSAVGIKYAYFDWIVIYINKQQLVDNRNIAVETEYWVLSVQPSRKFTRKVLLGQIIVLINILKVAMPENNILIQTQ